MRCTFWLLPLLSFAFLNWQDIIARKVVEARHVPPFTAVINSVLSGQIAFSDTVQMKVYIDGSRLRFAPNTFLNVMVHECGHLLGGQHGDGSLGMAYMVTELPNGTVVNDKTLLMDIDCSEPSHWCPV